MERNDFSSSLLDDLELLPFKQRFPWLGGDLQTLRDTFISEKLPIEEGERIEISVPEMPCGHYAKGNLLSLLDIPSDLKDIRGLILMLHGLGGSSRRQGLRRMAIAFLASGFAVLRLNLRGADPGRFLAGGTYSAKCNTDLIPAIKQAREICDRLSSQNNHLKERLPLFGVGISLGGTMLLNACLDNVENKISKKSILDGLVCISSPLDLAACSVSIERPRNRIYQKWLLGRLIRQTLADPFGINDDEKQLLLGNSMNQKRNISSIRDFDSVITAPRWGYKNVDHYYHEASPLKELLEESFYIPKTLLIQSIDDPWVPFESAKDLKDDISESYKKERLNILLTNFGGHNGFHGLDGCWGDELVKRWLLKVSSEEYC